MNKSTQVSDIMKLNLLRMFHELMPWKVSFVKIKSFNELLWLSSTCASHRGICDKKFVTR